MVLRTVRVREWVREWIRKWVMEWVGVRMKGRNSVLSLLESLFLAAYGPHCCLEQF